MDIVKRRLIEKCRPGRLLLAAALGTLLITLGLPLSGAVRITSVQIDSPERAVISAAGDPGVEQQLLTGLTVTAINTPLARALTGGDGVARFTVALTAPAAYFRVQQLAPGQRHLTTVAATSPFDGERGISVNRETIFRFSAPLAKTTVLGQDRFYATFGGRKILSRAELSSDGLYATLFYLEPLPGGARVSVTFDSAGVKDHLGREIDAAGDGTAGGVKVIQFNTYSTAPLPGTAVVGRVLASEVQTASAGAGGGLDQPLEGVIITVDGREQELRAVTDANGEFTLEPVPPSRFFVHIDGRQAKGSVWPDGSYYPVVGKAWDAVAGRTNNPAGGTGVIYLPLVTAGTLQPVSATEDKTISLPASVVANNPGLEGVSITVPANSLYSESGGRNGSREDRCNFPDYSQAGP